MSLSNQHLFDKTYQNNSKQLQQFIELSMNSLSVAQFDFSQNLYVGLDTYDFGPQENWFSCLKQIERVYPKLLLSENKPIQLCFTDALYTLVPKALFDEEELETYLKFTHGINNTDNLELSFDIIENLQLVVVYAIPKEITDFFNLKSAVVKWHHFSKPLLEAASLNKGKEPLFQIHIQKSRFDVLLLKGKELQFFNSFKYESVDDFAYYLLYVMEQLQLDRDSDVIDLVGEFETESDLYNLLYKYVRNPKVGTRPKAVNFSAILSEIPVQYHYNLFNQHLCE